MAPFIPTHLTDLELVTAVARLARDERSASTDLVAHLAEFDARKLHLAAGFSSLFVYCCEVLHLSEHETCNRIVAARAARRFPVVLEELAEGRVHLTTIRLLAPHLTHDNHRELLDAASHLKKAEVEELLAERFPRPDVATAVRKLPGSRRAPASLDETLVSGPPPRIATGFPLPCPVAIPSPAPEGRGVPSAMTEVAASVPAGRPGRVVPLAPDRYEIRFTASGATRDKLRRVQDHLRHAIPTGEIAEIFDRALTLLLEDVARKRLAEVGTPAKVARPAGTGSRHIPAHVRRAVWQRDAGRCAFEARNGRRCSATSFLEFHHVRPYAAGGDASAGNIQLRCRAHNAHEAELFYGPLRDVEPSMPGGVASIRWTRKS